jgi:hypothetical protein
MPAPSINSSSLSSGAVGLPYSQSLQASGGTLPLTWSVTPGLPPGLQLNPGTGEIHGTPTFGFPALSYTFSVIDSSNPALTGSAVLTFGIESNQMSKRLATLIASFLLAVSILTALGIYSLWSSRPISEANISPNCGGVASPTVRGISPAKLDVGSSAGILIEGCAFPTAPPVKIKINGTDRTPASIDNNWIRVSLSANDVAVAGPVQIVLSVGDNAFDSRTVWVTPPSFYWRAFRSTPIEISLEMQLLLLVLCTGAFGSSIYALKSLADYEGEEKLYRSWSLYYLIQPFEGAGVAFLFYVAIRGGFLAGTGADVKSVNQFGMCAIAGLAGAFSDLAFLKLREVFQALFKPQDNRDGKVSSLKIVTTSLPDGTNGQPYSQNLQALGGTGALTWSVTPGLPPGLTLDAKAGTIHGIPTAAFPSSSYKFAVTDSSVPPASSSVSLTLKVT